MSDDDREGAHPPHQAPAFDADADFTETLQRCVIVSLLESVCHPAVISHWAGWQYVADRTDARFGPTKTALRQFGPRNSEICTIHDDARWESVGGARAYVHAWLMAIDNLLERIAWIRTDAFLLQQPHQRRLQLPFVGCDEQERGLCAARDLLVGASTPRVYTAEFWGSFEDGHAHFWEIWWGTALGNLGIQSIPASDAVLADSRRRLNLLRDAAVALFAQSRDKCLDEMDTWLSECDDDWLTMRTQFMYAADCLGLLRHVETELTRYALEREPRVGVRNPYVKTTQRE
jgi:hypothetical protein